MSVEARRRRGKRPYLRLNKHHGRRDFKRPIEAIFALAAGLATKEIFDVEELVSYASVLLEAELTIDGALAVGLPEDAPVEVGALAATALTAVIAASLLIGLVFVVAVVYIFANLAGKLPLVGGTIKGWFSPLLHLLERIAHMLWSAVETGADAGLHLAKWVFVQFMQSEGLMTEHAVDTRVSRATHTLHRDMHFVHGQLHKLFEEQVHMRRVSRLEHDRVEHHLHHLQHAVDLLWSEMGSKQGRPSQHLLHELERLRTDETRLGHYVHSTVEPEVRTLREQLRQVREELKHLKQPHPKGQPYPNPWPRLKEEQREIEKLKGGGYADPWPRISHEEHQLTKVQHEVETIQQRLKHLHIPPLAHRGLTPEQAHELHRANHFAVTLAPLLALAPIGAAEVERLVRFASGRCGCVPNVSIPNVAVDAAIADQLIINGI